MTKSEDRTTELVAEKPHPRCRLGAHSLKTPNHPDDQPKTAVLRVAARKSLKLAPGKSLIDESEEGNRLD